MTDLLQKEKINYQITIPYLSIEKIISIVKKNYSIKKKKINHYYKKYLNFKDFQKQQHLLGSFQSFNCKNNFTDMKKATLFLTKKLSQPFLLTHEILFLELAE